MKKWVKINSDKVVSVSENKADYYEPIDLTDEQLENGYSDLLSGKWLWNGSELVLNPDWQEPLDSVKVDKQIEKREFGKRLLAEIEVELNVDEIMANNPSQGLALQQSLGGIIQSLNNGYLNTALIQINQIEPNQLITQEIIDKYVAKISDY